MKVDDTLSDDVKTKDTILLFQEKLIYLRHIKQVCLEIEKGEDSETIRNNIIKHELEKNNINLVYHPILMNRLMTDAHTYVGAKASHKTKKILRKTSSMIVVGIVSIVGTLIVSKLIR